MMIIPFWKRMMCSRYWEPLTQIEAMGEFMGKVVRDGVETDMVTLSFGIVIGLLIGTLSVTVGGVSIGLGSAGG
ncbi:hypothetical protein, partial [Sulfurovum sp.]|uniref:hypothetical protein n=1 Tax=Sulfurovum sp. TaxID=1969726 RepID=UPI0025D97B4B